MTLAPSLRTLGIAVNSQERFAVVENHWGSDAFWLDTRTRKHTALCDAISDAERSWENGTCDAIWVVGCGPLKSKVLPRLFWLQHRAEQSNWRILIDEGTEQLLVAQPPGISPPYLYTVPAKEVRVFGVSPGHFEPLHPGGESVLEILEKIWKLTRMAYRALGLPVRIYFDGLSVKNDYVAMYLREELA